MPYFEPKLRYLRGLCNLCPMPVEPGFTRCPKHREIDKQNAKKNMKLLRVRRKKEGKCTCCGHGLHPIADKGRSNCIHCQVEKDMLNIKNGRKR